MCWLASCSTDDTNDQMVVYDLENITYGGQGIYEGEWTVNKQVVDTARLKVTNVFKVRLPEAYLGFLCFEEEYYSSVNPSIIEYRKQPVTLSYIDQGYTTNAIFSSFSSTEKSYNGTMLFTNVSFTVAINGVDHQVDLLSEEPGSAVFRNDNGLWTIGITINNFLVTNTQTHEVQMRAPHAPIALYYNAKKRIQ